MCGRFTQAVPWAVVWAFSQPLVLEVPEEPVVPRYNIASTQEAWVIAGDGRGGAKAGRMRWGLVPHWAEDVKSGLATFNARLESAATKPTFRQAFERRHCLVPASGYYEWVGTGKAKQPWYIRPERDPVLFFAGIWDRWVPPNGAPMLSFSILTMAAAGELARLHDRQPVMLAADLARAWLTPDHLSSEQGLTAAAMPSLCWYPVATAVGNVREDGEHLIKPVDEPLDVHPVPRG